MPATAATAPRTAPRRRVKPRAVKMGLVGVLLLVALLAGGWLWLRGSSLVAVEDVKVTGVSGPGGGAIRSNLESLALDMTTPRVDRQALDEAMARYPVVKSLEVSTDFPHGMRIAVTERKAVAALAGSGIPVPVAPDGVILRGQPTTGLPVVTARLPYGATRVPGGSAREQVLLIGAAPDHLRRRVSTVVATAGGYTIRVAGYPELRFGAAERIDSKWASASRILADPGVAGATYVDLRVPERPAVGPASGESEGFVP